MLRRTKFKSYQAETSAIIYTWDTLYISSFLSLLVTTSYPTTPSISMELWDRYMVTGIKMVVIVILEQVVAVTWSLGAKLHKLVDSIVLQPSCPLKVRVFILQLHSVPQVQTSKKFLPLVYF